jgi:hypothetical protein
MMPFAKLSSAVHRRFKGAFVLTATAIALSFSVVNEARADIIPEGRRILKVSVTFSAPADGHIVAYPTDCMGLDTKLNPQLEFFQNYDVVEAGKPREPYKFCGEKTKVWVLDTDSFKKVPGEKVPAFVRSEWKLEQLSKVSVPERPLFFQKSPHVHATGYAMPAQPSIKEVSPLTDVTETVTFAGIPAKVASVKLVYKYTDGQTEEHTYAAGSRPQPKRAEARDWMAGLVNEPGTDASDAGAPEAGAGSSGTLDRKMFVVSAKKGPTENPTPPAVTKTAPKKLDTSSKLMLGFAIVAIVAAGVSLREDGKKKN